MSNLAPHQHLSLFLLRNGSVADEVEGRRSSPALGCCVRLESKFQKSHKRGQKDAEVQQKGAELTTRGELLSMGMSEMPFTSKLANDNRAGLAAWKNSAQQSLAHGSKDELQPL